MTDIIEEMEEYFLDILARIDDGDEKALEELKIMKKSVAKLDEMLALIDDNDTLETIEKKFKALEDKFDELLMAMQKVVG